jgi:CheY-like chemotaxis protein
MGDVAEMICDMLNIVGINGTFVCSAEKALEILTSGQTFDLIFSDLKMPGLIGLEF